MPSLRSLLLAPLLPLVCLAQNAATVASVALLVPYPTVTPVFGWYSPKGGIVSATNVAQGSDILASDVRAMASAANNYMKSVATEAGYAAYVSGLPADLRSELLAAPTNAAAGSALASYPRAFFTALPQSAQGFWSSVIARESQVFAAAATAVGLVAASPPSVGATAAPSATSPAKNAASGLADGAAGFLMGAAAVGAVVAAVAL